MKKNTVWVVASNSSLARVFKAETNHNLETIETLVHPASRLHASDLTSDQLGRTFESSQSGTRHAMEPKTDPQMVEFQEFAKILSDYLNSSLEKGLYNKLYLAANPTFLGLLREKLKKETLAKISHQLDKDITHQTAEQIAAHFNITL